MSGGRWLVTGGAGYIGAHVVRALLRSGAEVVVLDDLSTGLASRVPAGIELIEGSVTDSAQVEQTLRRIAPDGVVHLAAKKSPTESVADPLRYGRENVGGMLSLLEGLLATGGRRVVFSSSCAVYGTTDVDQVDEEAPKAPESPYGASKLYGEQLLTAAAAAHGLGAINLRYFNVVGAAEPSLADTGCQNLVPLVLRALRVGAPPKVYGADYPTPDGTCVRDYVHVEDIAQAHVRAAEALTEDPTRIATYNVGRGQGSSVLEVLDAVRAASGRSFDHEVAPRRPGDPARVVGQVTRIAEELGWSATRDLDDMVRSAWLAEQASPHRTPAPLGSDGAS
jgi:UDP-glucose 4-epimerase